MAVSYSRVGDTFVDGHKRVGIADVTLDSSYPTGGESLDAGEFGLSSIERAETFVKSATGAGVNVANAFYDESTGKVLVYDETPAQAANAADLSNVVIRVKAYGTD